MVAQYKALSERLYTAMAARSITKNALKCYIFYMFFGSNKVTINTDKEKIEETLSRGVDRIVDGEKLREKMNAGKQLRVKLGIDPTSQDIHLGRATQLLKLRDFQELGHTIILIIGDATGVIGDTSDKESERPMLSREEVNTNAEKYFEQAGKILDMRKVEKAYNSTWLDKLTFSEIGKQADAFSVADFIARENIKKRLDEVKRVSLRETLYPLMQGYDSVEVKADVEIGGSDQWFNLLAGRTLQETYGQQPQSVITNMLIAGLDGRKMSSSWGNTIALNAKPNDMYGKVMSLNDTLMKEYFVTCTRVPLQEVESILSGDPKSAKMRLAKEIVSFYHGKEKADNAEQDFEKTFKGGGISEDAKEVTVKKGEKLSDVLLREKIIGSKNEFRRLVSEGAIMNMTENKKVGTIEETIEKKSEFRVGKRRFIRLRI